MPLSFLKVDFFFMQYVLIIVPLPFILPSFFPLPSPLHLLSFCLAIEKNKLLRDKQHEKMKYDKIKQKSKIYKLFLEYFLKCHVYM